MGTTVLNISDEPLPVYVPKPAVGERNWLDEPLPVYVPKPAVGERNWLGSLKTPSAKFPHEPYKPTMSDIYSYLGAAVGVALTLLATALYTDLFGMNIKKKSTSVYRTEADKEESSEAESPEVTKSSESSKSTEHEVYEKAPSDDEHSKTASEASAEKSSHSMTEHHEKPCCEERESQKHSEERAEGSSDSDSTHDKSKSDSTHKESVSSEQPGISNEKEATPEGFTIVTSTGEEVPKSVEYLLVGAGAAAYYASLAIRARHADAKVLMIGEEAHLPYNRPPLSKELWWYGDDSSVKNLQYEALSGKKRDIFFEAEGFFVSPKELPTTAHGGVSLLKGHRVVKLVASEKKAYLEDGTCIRYDKCLLATGGKPKVLPELEKGEELKSKVDDFRKLNSICESSNSVAIVGGGFLGSELAYSIRRKFKDIKISQIVSDNGNLGGVLPESLAKKATEALRGVGVDVITCAKVSYTFKNFGFGCYLAVTGVEKQGNSLELEVNGDKRVGCDYVVVAVGIEPDVSIAEASGLEVDDRLGGISTDAELRVQPDIWAAGDTASFYDKSLGRRRMEHWEAAQVTGRLAGENMTGAGKAFWYQPAYFTKIAPRWHINAVGVTDSSLPTVSVFAKDEESNDNFERGVVFYKGDEGKIVGVLLLNVFGSSIDVSRRLIEEGKNVEDFHQLAKLYPLYKVEEPEDKKDAEK
ncbi:unnamed protein product [Nippostrongylus brasiliensis]|uniref:Uncharacterized protein n=1 Tax=Nippostrongylus brasiliensis TaxID=27835 RepID=A0A3P7AT53_NIPBR|nr:unnamed protein product [Nippostrongylus brasiliensis]